MKRITHFARLDQFSLIPSHWGLGFYSNAAVGQVFNLHASKNSFQIMFALKNQTSSGQKNKLKSAHDVHWILHRFSSTPRSKDSWVQSYDEHSIPDMTGITRERLSVPG